VTAICVLTALIGAVSPWIVGYWGVVLTTLSVTGAYGVRITLRALNEAPALGRRLAIPVIGLLAARPWAAIDDSLVAHAVLTLPVLVTSRVFAYGVIRCARGRGHLRQPTVIVGSGAVGKELARLLERHRAYGLLPVGLVDTVPAIGRHHLPVPFLGTVQHLGPVLREYEVQHVIVADGHARGSESDWARILRSAVLNGIEVHVVPRFPELGLVSEGAGTDDIWGIPVCRVRRSAPKTGSWHLKRCLDVALSTVLLLVLSPIMTAIALAVRLSSPGPVIYRQHRIGQHGKPFKLLKFRSMRTTHDGATSWAAAAVDQTAVGRWLRRTSLDELPQLWNVIRGDMSLVGPRPERPHFVQRFAAEIPEYADRHRASVGMTGWAQVHGLKGDGTSLHDRIRFDNYYIERWSLWLDLVTMARTVGTIGRDVIGGLRSH
jgi:exopolysaccharide biosynthesis polyprenyl glycosylphosphotransferase